MKTGKNMVLSLSLVAIAAILAGAFYAAFWVKKYTDDRFYALERRLNLVVDATTGLTVRLNGFEIYSGTRFQDVTNDAPTFMFIGHIYPRNGINSRIRTRGDPVGYLVRFSQNILPNRIVFGGDSITSPTPEALTYLRQLKDRFPRPVRYILGNHEEYWNSLSKKPEIFREIFGNRFEYEDVDGVRFVYLHSVEKDGQYRIDEEQVRFLSSALEPGAYRYALVFLHHALWAGNTLVSNTIYEDAAATKARWVDVIVPILRKGNVKGVFSGDGGYFKPGQQSDIATIPHYFTGWSRRLEIPPEWLTVTLYDDRIGVIWHKYIGGDHFVKY